LGLARLVKDIGWVKRQTAYLCDLSDARRTQLLARFIDGSGHF